jgi:hypothetical protein
MATIAVCLYSKYSQRCKEFLDNVTDDMGIQMLSIDNKQIRNTILKDKQGYHIKTVPCLFIFFSNGRLEKHEGSDAFVWLRKLKESSSSEVSLKQEYITETSTMEQENPEIEEESSNSEKLIEKETDLRKASEQLITRKQDNIKELAQMMQKQREFDEEKINPPPPTGTTGRM